MKNQLIITAAFLAATMALCACGQTVPVPRQQEFPQPSETPSVVYYTREITPESLVKIFEALGVEPQGRVAVKISSGEAGGHNYLKPELIGELVQSLDGTIVECNTAYPGSRNTVKKHMKLMSEHGFDKIAPVDIMDAEGSMTIPVSDTTWILKDIVGSHLAEYGFLVNLAHFKGHAMGGYGGVLKNASIGIASARGKAYIHTAGVSDKLSNMWFNLPKGWNKVPENNDPFIEAMASAAQAVHNYFQERGGVVYIDVMNNISVDCDCVSHPAEPLLQDRGIMASLDPVAVDKACLDLVFNITPSEGDDNGPLLERIKSRHGTHIVEWGEHIGLGSSRYVVVDLDRQ